MEGIEASEGFGEIPSGSDREEEGDEGLIGSSMGISVVSGVLILVVLSREEEILVGGLGERSLDLASSVLPPIREELMVVDGLCSG